MDLGREKHEEKKDSKNGAAKRWRLVSDIYNDPRAALKHIIPDVAADPHASESPAEKNDDDDDDDDDGVAADDDVIVSDEKKSEISDDDLRAAIGEILKQVDYNTTTFTDVRKLLAARFETDLSARKTRINQMIMEELFADNDDE